jgi:anti-sigma regulatory factor (Ser/Thr protein kinase)
MSDSEDPAVPRVTFEFGHDAGAPRRARQALNALFCDPDDPIADDVRLAASELVTNVVVHTADGGVMRVHDPRPDVPLHLEVEDSGDGVPRSPAVLDEHRGRGLRIVAQVADGFGVRRLDAGKVVWADFDRTRRIPTAASDASGNETPRTDET